MADEIPYWEYTFLADDDCGSDGFKVEYDDHFWADKDGNDLLLMSIALLPQCVWSRGRPAASSMPTTATEKSI